MKQHYKSTQTNSTLYEYASSADLIVKISRTRSTRNVYQKYVFHVLKHIRRYLWSVIYKI